MALAGVEARIHTLVVLCHAGKADMQKAIEGSDEEGSDEEEEYVAQELEDDEDDVNEDAEYVDKLANGVSGGVG